MQVITIEKQLNDEAKLKANYTSLTGEASIKIMYKGHPNKKWTSTLRAKIDFSKFKELCYKFLFDEKFMVDDIDEFFEGVSYEDK